MKVLCKEEGFALVMSLMLTLICLCIIMTLMYVVNNGVKSSGLNKPYRTSLDASYGGTGVLATDIIPFVFRNFSSPTLISSLTSNTGIYQQLHISVGPGGQACLKAKLKSNTADWPSTCDAVALPSQNPDLAFNLPSTGDTPFNIYTKIVDTKVGNSDVGGLSLEGASVTESTPFIKPKQQPYMYTIEVQGRRQGSTGATTNLEVIYAY